MTQVEAEVYTSMNPSQRQLVDYYKKSLQMTTWLAIGTSISILAILFLPLKK